jgi:hypothetical protein
MILDAFRTLLRRRFYPLAASTEKMGRMGASAKAVFFCLALLGLLLAVISQPLAGEVIIFERNRGIRYSLRPQPIGFWGALPQCYRQIR